MEAVPIAVFMETNRDRIGTQKKPPPKPSNAASAPPLTLFSAVPARRLALSLRGASVLFGFGERRSPQVKTIE